MHHHDWHEREHCHEHKREFPGRGGRGGRGFFERGAIKFVILDLLKDQPRHGYDVIQEIEGRSGGFYTPSPGVVYPTLQALEDQGYVRAATEESGKRVYSITEEGRAYLEGHEEQVGALKGRFAFRVGLINKDELHDTVREMKRMTHDVRHAIHSVMNDPDRLREVRGVMEEASRKIGEILSR